MLYAILCYDSEGTIGALSREEDDAMIGRLGAVQRKIAVNHKIGPVARLMPTTTAVTVRRGGEPLVIDGPFAETKEQLLGFYVLDCGSLEDAIEAARLMAREHQSGAYEVRPIRSFRAGPP